MTNMKFSVFLCEPNRYSDMSIYIYRYISVYTYILDIDKERNFTSISISQGISRNNHHRILKTKQLTIMSQRLTHC